MRTERHTLFNALIFIFKDIRFWILLFFLIRLIGISNAPLETGHNWRQTLTSMIARNFLQNGPDILHPQIDMAGNLTGIIGSEFPLFNFLIYGMASIFGFEHWHGRLINLIVSSLSVFYFYKLLKHLFNHQLAFNAAIILLSSIWFAFSRKIMPDTFSISLVITGLYFGITYLSKGRLLNLFLFFILVCLGILSKIPALSLLAPLGLLIIRPPFPTKRIVMLYSATLLALIPVYIWYFQWVPHLVETYHYELYFPKKLREGIFELKPLIPELLQKFYFSAFHSYFAFLAFLIGLSLLYFKNERSIAFIFISIAIVFVAFIIKTGAVFPLHNYYIIPFVPIMAVVAGFGLTKIKPVYSTLVLIAIVAEGLANQQHDFKVQESELYKLSLENITNRTIPKESLIVINGGQSPQDIYFANRKGWSIDKYEITTDEQLNYFSSEGARFYIQNLDYLKIKQLNYAIIYEDNHYLIYDLAVR